MLRLYFIVGLRRASFKGLSNPYWARLRLRAFLAVNQTCAIQHKQALDSFQNAINLLSELPSWIGRRDSPATRPLASFLDIGVASNLIFNDMARAAVCDAVFYHHGAKTVLVILNSLQNPHDRGRDFYIFSVMHSRFWTFAATCVIGGVSLVREAALALQQTPNQSRLQWTACLSRCLYIPALIGHEDTIHLLFDLGANLNFAGPEGVSQNLIPLAVAAKNGQKHIVQLLLHPSYGLSCTGWEYECAIDAAARCPEPSTRRQLVQLLLSHGRDLSQPDLRNRLFLSACLLNDITLAQSVLDNGAVKMADAFSEGGWGETALSLAASRGHVESVQLILHSDFIPAATEAVENARWAALRAAVGANSILVFKELLPYTKQERYLEVFTMAAAIDGGDSVMADLLARVELNTRFQGVTVGESSLIQALVHLRPRNVNFLLKHRVRVKRHVRVLRSEYSRSSHAYNVIQDFLRQYDVPLLELS